jgi:23S rRNA (cytidine2498-2'-O)-methyltransferase
MPELTAYLAPRGFLEELLAEVREVQLVHDHLVVCHGAPQGVVWVDNIWFDARYLPAPSIGKAAAQLKAIQRNWACYPTRWHRRCTLIQEKLPHVSAKPLAFGSEPPSAPLGSWTLTEPDQLLAASRCSSPFQNGRPEFIEDKKTPPNRAYLKLWEVLTRLPERPGPGDFCLDLGSSPGGWTWVLQSLGARVLSVDKAGLEGGIDRLERVEFREQSAFALIPEEVGPVDWLFCDIACYPRRLLTMIQRWISSGNCRNFVCTIKLQGQVDMIELEAFRSIPGSRVVHLWHNKHELTWIRLDPV